MEAGGLAVRAISLMYHDVMPASSPSASGFMNPGAMIYKLPEVEFRRHISLLAEAGVSPCPDAATTGYNRPLFFLTFDDGGVSSRDVAAGILEELGWRGHFFITTGRIDTSGFLSVGALRDLHARGHAVGSHSVTHPRRMSFLTAKQLQQEWADSQRRLEDILGAPVLSASVPGGYSCRQVEDAALEAGYRALFTSEPVQRVEQRRGGVILGRYSVQRGVSAETAVRLALGDRAACGRQYLLWNSKKAAKALGGTAWLRVREGVLRHWN
jgi:peptidoglycan/xylan/chitin deacetylase (PgdA/CDA1 family)